MHAPKLIGSTAYAALALSLALASSQGALAQSNSTSGNPTARVETSNPFAPYREPGREPLAQSAATGVPLPDFIELAPLSKADVSEVEKPAAASRLSEPPATATIETPAAPVAETAHPVQSSTPIAETPAVPSEIPSAASVQPAAPGLPQPKADTAPAPDSKPAGTASTSPSAGTRPIDIQSAVPVPETLDMPPLTASDIGGVQMNPADFAIAERLKELVAGRLDRFLDRKRDREALEEFYQARKFAPVWFDMGAPNGRMTAAITRLKAADADGLDASDYPTPDIKALDEDPAARAQAELRLTSSVLAYARQAQGGRVSPSRISTNIEFTPPVSDPAEVLQKVAKADNVTKTLDAFNPQHDGFLALKRKLAELRGTVSNDHVVHIPTGRTMRVGQSDERISLVRERLGVTGEGDVYDAELAQAVKAFQKEKGVGQDGLLGPRTVELLNGGRTPGRDVDSILSNMERWRWLPRDLGQAYVMVNIPDFTLKVMKNNKTTFHTRIVVGKPNTPSPSFSAMIENILVNPTWHVPQSIIYNEYLPALQQDPSVLARMGLVMEHNRDGTISIRQPPGERNALGRIKFNFPNRFQVYLHDTPDKSLFNHDRRAYSHGCMRVQNPTKFGEALANIALPGENITSERLQGMFGSGERWFNFKKKIPVYLVYLNTYVDDGGKLVVRPDLYGYDQRVQSALRGQYMAISERSQRVTPVAMKRARQIVQEVPRQPQQRGFFPFPWFQ